MIQDKNSCWEWKTGCFSLGYGCFSIKRKPHLAHRISWNLTFGNIPTNLFVCHKCDNPPCVRPDHLYLGTPKDNMDDKFRRGRYKYTGPKNPAKGEKQGSSKLSNKQANNIRTIYRTSKISQRALANKYNVHQRVIWRIVNNLGYKNG